MLSKEHIDPITSVEILFNEVFQHVFQNGAAREYLGFSQISQIFSAEGFPGWYLWFNDIKGAYSIAITDEYVNSAAEDSKNIRQRDAVNAVQLVLRYFPHIDDEILKHFSRAEQIFRLGTHFDATGTPTFDGAREMHESFYTIGHMTISLNQSDNFIDFSCRASERWRNYRLDDLALSDFTGAKNQKLPPDSLDRDVEGWNLSRHVFDKIVSAYIFLIQWPPSFIGASACPSIEYLIDKSDTIREIKNEHLMEFSLLVSFSTNGNVGDAEKTLSSEAKNLLGIWSDSVSIPAEWHNQLWWKISDHHFHDDNCYLCSCYHEQH